MGEKIQNNILNKVESAIELVKKRNLRNFENAFLSYEETEPLYDDAQIQGIDNKILRLPGNFFMSVEYCWHNAENEYHTFDSEQHGWGCGKGTPAEGWVKQAVALWETQFEIEVLDELHINDEGGKLIAQNIDIF